VEGTADMLSEEEAPSSRRSDPSAGQATGVTPSFADSLSAGQGVEFARYVGREVTRILEAAQAAAGRILANARGEEEAVRRRLAEVRGQLARVQDQLGELLKSLPGPEGVSDSSAADGLSGDGRSGPEEDGSEDGPAGARPLSIHEQLRRIRFGGSS
jgi:hypothetical protein